MNLHHQKVYKSQEMRGYKTLYHFDKVNMVWISEYLFGEYFTGVSEKTRNKALTSKQKMSVFLQYITNQGYQSGIAQEMTNLLSHYDKIPDLTIKGFFRFYQETGMELTM